MDAGGLISFGSIAAFLISCAGAFIFGVFLGLGLRVANWPYPWR